MTAFQPVQCRLRALARWSIRITVAIPPVSSALPHRAASGLRVRRRVDSV